MIRLLPTFLALAFSTALPLSAAEVSFRNHVQPILAKTGCSSGACHGAAAGQGGFKLSLRGYDTEGDWLTLTRGAFGRRINTEDPARSLMLSAEALVEATAPGQTPTLADAVDEALEANGGRLPLSLKPVAFVFGPENGAVST